MIFILIYLENEEQDNESEEEAEGSSENQKFMDMFHEYQFVAKGGFGSCSKVLHFDSGLVLIRKIGHVEKMKSFKDVMYLKNEARILQKCKHEYVVKHYKSFNYNDRYYLFMEMADLGDLQTYVDNVVKKNTNETLHWKQSKILRIFVQLLLALTKIHSLGIMHRDIKGKNALMFKNGVTKLCDFGISKEGDEGVTKIGDYK